MNQAARILVVDDEVPIRFVIKHVLVAAGYDVSTASDGDEAIKLATDETFDLILSDLVMPGKDGIEMILSLRASQPGTPIIAMSGGLKQGVQSFLPLAKKLGACRTLSKPFDQASLLNVIEEEIGKLQPLSA